MAPGAPPSRAPGRGAARWIAPLAKLTAVWAFVVIAAGGAVTSTRSGDADPHSLTFEGRLLPSLERMLRERGLFFEHGHRIAVAILGVLTLALAAGAFLVPVSRSARGLAAAAVVVLLLIAVLGQLRVISKEGRVLPIVHVSVAMPFLGLCAALAVVTGRRWGAAAEELSRGKGLGLEDAAWLGNGAVLCAAFTYVQVVLGAVPRHTGLWSIPHIVWGFAVFTAAVMVAGRVMGRHSHLPSVFGPGVGMLLLVVAQFFLGFMTYVVRPEGAKAQGTGLYELSASLHSMLGGLMLVASVLLLLRALRLRRLVRESGGAPPGAAPPEGVP